MSYRNPQIITPPNYGEIFARNMAYGQSIVQSALSPVLNTIDKKRRERELLKDAGFKAREEYNQLVDYTYDEKLGTLEGMLEQNAMLNADEWAENEALKLAGKRDAKTYRTVQERLLKELKDTKSVATNLSDILTYYDQNKENISTASDFKFFGLIEAITNPAERSFKITKNELGETIYQYKDLNGDDISYTHDELQKIKKSNIVLQNDYNQGPLAQTLNTVLRRNFNRNNIITGPASPQIRGNYDPTKPEGQQFKPDINGQTIEQQTSYVLRNKDAAFENAKLELIASSAIGNNTLKSYILDERYKLNNQQPELDAIKYGKRFNISDTEKLAAALKSPFALDQTIKNDLGEDVDVTKIARDIAYDGLTTKMFLSNPESSIFYDNTKNGIYKKPNYTAYKPLKPNEDDINKKFAQEELISSIPGIAQELMQLEMSTASQDAKVAIDKNTGTVIPKTQKDFGVLNTNPDTINRTASILYKLGYNIERNSDGTIKPTVFQDIEGAGLFSIFYLDKNLGVTQEDGVSKEFRIESGKTTIFDVLEHRLKAAGIKISAKELKEQILSDNKDELLKKLELQKISIGLN